MATHEAARSSRAVQPRMKKWTIVCGPDATDPNARSCTLIAVHGPRSTRRASARRDAKIVQYFGYVPIYFLYPAPAAFAGFSVGETTSS